MLSLSLAVALILDRIFTELNRFRDLGFINRLENWLLASKPVKDWSGNIQSLLLLTIVTLLAIIIENLIDSVLGDLFVFLYYIAIAFLCIDARVIFDDLADELDVTKAGRGSENETASIFYIANQRLYAGIFWFVIGGLFALVFYRLLCRAVANDSMTDGPEGNPWSYQLLGWMEWPASVLSSFWFMLCGNFEAGLSRLLEVSLVGDDMIGLNRIRLNETGSAAISASAVSTDNPTLSSRSRGLCQRALLLWMLFVLFVDLLL